MEKLSHINEQGKAEMVDVGNKPDQIRQATAEGFIKLSETTIKLIRENKIKKGDVLTVAEIAGIQAAKQCPALIPLCHTLMLNKVKVDTKITDKGVVISSLVRCQGKTGVEMEALTAVSIALLTVYDMCKAVDKTMIMSEIKLLEKTKTDLA
ncbi:MAG: cyclic pyranopterin monophosphate synthase MoaC [Marinilabiliales bacterium]|nr:MAG: cyclic pyranopterin monophosphate synthase MoaC [Marinilabiliales bacterium]